MLVPYRSSSLRGPGGYAMMGISFSRQALQAYILQYVSYHVQNNRRDSRGDAFWLSPPCRTDGVICVCVCVRVCFTGAGETRNIGGGGG